ncbi:MAG: peptidase catalytic core [Gammaproteobacteria bacterium]|nr:peptidase catalytic core [Gammaproteobacteria bacterium]
MKFRKEEYRNRRIQFMKMVGEGNIAILNAAPEVKRNGSDNHYPYRQDSDFYYLTGFNEPQAIAIFIPGREEGEFILFNREHDPETAVWQGPMAGQSGACEHFGADQSFPFTVADEKIPSLIEGCKRLYYSIGRDMSFNRLILKWFNKVQSAQRSGGAAPSELLNIEAILHEMRLIKSPYEIECMRKAGEISAQAHIDAMKACRPGMREYELEAYLQYGFTKGGSRSPAYPHIVGSGANSCILHYSQNDDVVEDGDVVLIDAGAEYENYASDITRTFPANGRFSPEQRAVYQAVLNTQLAVIDAIKPGVLWQKLQEISEEFILNELIKIGILSGDPQALITQRAWHRFYLHRFGHWLGLDVHDVGAYKVKGQWRALEPGMVLTVEPGIYIPAHSKDVEERWWNIGVRIEDDVLVTGSGCEVLSAKAPKTIEAIEGLMAR